MFLSESRRAEGELAFVVFRQAPSFPVWDWKAQPTWSPEALPTPTLLAPSNLSGQSPGAVALSQKSHLDSFKSSVWRRPESESSICPAPSGPALQLAGTCFCPTLLSPTGAGLAEVSRGGGGGSSLLSRGGPVPRTVPSLPFCHLLPVLEASVLLPGYFSNQVTRGLPLSLWPIKTHRTLHRNSGAASSSRSCRGRRPQDENTEWGGDLVVLA